MAAHHSTGAGSRGFHDGERAVQRLAGVQQEAARLAGMLDPPEISAGLAAFLSELTFAAITARDRDGRLWTSPLIGSPGFLQVLDATTLRITSTPAIGDPLQDLPADQPIGLIAIDYRRRRRFRLNGTLDLAADGRLRVALDEAFGNCPQFIPQRTVDPGPTLGTALAAPGAVAEHGPLTAVDDRTIRSTTSFILGTTHPQRGNDASHRGGAAGFLRRDGATLWWPDYPGNNLFNSLGNLQVDPEAALLVPDFDRRRALHLHGTAELVLSEPTGDESHTGRRIVFSPTHQVRTALPVISHLLNDYPRNPAVAG